MLIVASKHSIKKISHDGTLYLTIQDEHNKKQTLEASELKDLLIANGWKQFDSKHVGTLEKILLEIKYQLSATKSPTTATKN